MEVRPSESTVVASKIFGFEFGSRSMPIWEGRGRYAEFDECRLASVRFRSTWIEIFPRDDGEILCRELGLVGDKPTEKRNGQPVSGRVLNPIYGKCGSDRAF